MYRQINHLRREEFIRFNHNHRHHHRPSFFDYQRNSVFGQGYGNYGYYPQESHHNNFFGKFLGFGAVAALGYGIGKSGGIAPFFQKVGGFFNKLFGHKEAPREERREERREDLGDIKRREPLPARVENRQPQQPGLIGMDKLQAQSNKGEEERKAQREKETAEEKKTDTNTLLPTDKGYQLPEVVITAKRINKVESLPARAESNLPTGLNALKLTTPAPATQQPVDQKPVAEAPVKKPAEEKPSTQVDPNDKKIKPQEAINYVTEKNNGLLTKEQLSKMTPEQQKKYWEEIQGAILN